MVSGCGLAELLLFEFVFSALQDNVLNLFVHSLKVMDRCYGLLLQSPIFYAHIIHSNISWESLVFDQVLIVILGKVNLVMDLFISLPVLFVDQNKFMSCVVLA